MDVLSPVVSALRAGWQFYEDLQSADEQVRKSIRSLKQITLSLETTHHSLQKKSKSGPNKPYLEAIKSFASDMKRDADEVTEMLRKWNTIDGPTFRFPSFERLAARISFTISGKPDALKALVQELFAQNALISGEFAKMIDNNTDSATTSMPASSKVNILFLDDRNQGRSIVAQAYAQLVSSWTKTAKLTWPINKIMSAGLYVSNKSELLEIQEELEFKMQPGNETPYQTAIASVFGKNASLPNNATLHEKFAKRKSRGLTMDTFIIYDYIFVFVPQHKRDVERLITATKKKYGTRIVPAGKANVVLLGSFDGSKFDLIWNAKKDDDPVKQRANWDTCEKKIRLSFQGWLQKTQNWKKPPKAKVAS